MACANIGGWRLPAPLTMGDQLGGSQYEQARTIYQALAKGGEAGLTADREAGALA